MSQLALPLPDTYHHSFTEMPNGNILALGSEMRAIGGYQQLASLHQGINDFENTARFQVPVASFYSANFPYDKINAQGMSSLTELERRTLASSQE